MSIFCFMILSNFAFQQRKVDISELVREIQDHYQVI